ncbi:hypothetical protein [Mesorhizobium sp. GbtcB19]|uniref:hypothetical protein n=1 Tax=Mesorhizobium sp. GbtcB19 TaxID=2824764 RepID=UPI001C2F160A|nr:hypothetical protein [Mesorhizobium sp. GbtcB19]
MNETIANGETGHTRIGAFDGSLHYGGVFGHDFRDRQYGRRVEADRSWTVYHVFTGIPAHVEGALLVGLTRAQATKNMLDLNRRSAEARKAWAGALLAPERAGTQAGRP